MPPGCTRSGLLWIIYDEQGVPVEIEVRAHLDVTGEFTRLGLRLPAKAGPFMHQFKGDPVAIDNIDAYPALDPVTRETMRQMHMIATCFIPIFMGGRLAGVMTTSASDPVEFHARDIAVLRGVSDLAAVTLEKLQLAEETRRRAEQLTAATEIGRAATASFDLRSVLATTVNLIRDRFGFYHASIFIIEPGSNIAELRESTGEAGEQLKARKHRLAVGSKSLVGTATAQQQPVVVQDVRADPSYYPNPLLPDTRAEAVIPLMAGDTVVGALDVQSTIRGAFATGDIAILSTIASQLAVAVQNAGLFAQTQDAMAENASLFITSRALSEVKSAQGMLEVIAANAMPQGATRTALLWLHYNDKGEPVEIEIRAHLDIAGEHNERLGLRLPAEAAPLLQHLPPDPMVIANVETDPRLDPVTRQTLRRMKMFSTCLIPLNIAGHLVGIVTTSASQQTEFQPQEVSVLRGVADLLAVTLEKVQLAEETQHRAEQLAAAAEIGRAATASFDLASVLATTVNLIRDRFGFYHASIFIIEPGSNMAEVRESTGEAGRQLKARKHRLAVGSKSLVGTATAQQQPVVVQDVRADPSYYPNPLLPETRAEAVIPLIAGDTVVGAIDVQSTIRGVFSPDDTAILSTVAGQLAVAVQNARLYEQTARWANRERLANQITTKIRAVPAGDIDGMLRTAVTELRQALGASRAAVQLTSEPVRVKAQPQVSTGQIKAILDQIIAERSGGDSNLAQSVRTKLMLKGINIDVHTADAPDDPGLLARVTVIATEMGVTPKLPWHTPQSVLERQKEGIHG
jgi:GAF domain-containing protein